MEMVKHETFPVDFEQVTKYWGNAYPETRCASDTFGKKEERNKTL